MGEDILRTQVPELTPYAYISCPMFVVNRARMYVLRLEYADKMAQLIV